MNTKNMWLTAATLALTGLTTTGMANGGGLAFGRSQAPAPLEGTWVVTIQPIVCKTGIDVPNAPSVRSYLTFARGGTMTETNSNAAFEPGQRGPGHGYWERTGRTSYQFAFEAFIQFDSQLDPFRYKRGYQVHLQRQRWVLRRNLDDQSVSIRLCPFDRRADVLSHRVTGPAREGWVRCLAASGLRYGAMMKNCASGGGSMPRFERLNDVASPANSSRLPAPRFSRFAGPTTSA